MRSVVSRRQRRQRRTEPTDRGSLSRRRQRRTERRRLRPHRHNKRRIGEHDEIKNLIKFHDEKKDLKSKLSFQSTRRMMMIQLIMYVAVILTCKKKNKTCMHSA